MTSQLDLDQGGTFRGWARQWMGPSIGWIMVPLSNILLITTAGTVLILPSTSLVEVNVAGAVILKLPSVIPPSAGAGALPGLFANNPITIVDIGNKAQANPITIQPASGTETIMGLAQIQITVNYGGFTLQPISAQSTWNSISP